MIRLLLVDDQLLIRQGIQTLLELEPDLTVVGTASNGQEGLTQAAALLPDVVLMDVRMPIMDGIAATQQLTTQFPQIGVIILTTFDDDDAIFAGLRAGARGYILKDISSEEMARAVRAVAAGEALIQPSITRKVVAEFSRLSAVAPSTPSPLAVPLTERERQVLRALIAGRSNREIAELLTISEGTVKNHVSNLLAKLDVRDRMQAVLRAKELRLL